MRQSQSSASSAQPFLDVKTAFEIDRARTEADEMMNKLLEDPEVKILLEQKIGQLKLA